MNTYITYACIYVCVCMYVYIYICIMVPCGPRWESGSQRAAYKTLLGNNMPYCTILYYTILY